MTPLPQIRFTDLLAAAEPDFAAKPSDAAWAPVAKTEGALDAPVVETAAPKAAPALPVAPPIQTAPLVPPVASADPRPAPPAAPDPVTDPIGTAERVRQLPHQILPPENPNPRPAPAVKAADCPTLELQKAEEPEPESDAPTPTVAAPVDIAAAVTPHVPQIIPEPDLRAQEATPEPAPITAPPPGAVLVAPQPMVADQVDGLAAKAPAPVNITLQDWPAQIADRIAAAMPDTTSGTQSREISIDITPEHLGPLRLRVRVTEQGTEISVAAAHPEVAHLLKEAQPDLQRALAEAGQPAFQQSGNGSQGSSHGTQQHPAWRSTRSAPGSPDPIPDPIPSLPRADLPAAGLNLIA